MDHYDLHDKATTLADSESRYALARRVLKLEAANAAPTNGTKDTTDPSVLDNLGSAVFDTIHRHPMRPIN